mgnify:CR=1 FL=1
MSHGEKFSLDQARQLGESIGIDWATARTSPFAGELSELPEAASSTMARTA